MKARFKRPEAAYQHRAKARSAVAMAYRIIWEIFSLALCVGFVTPRRSVRRSIASTSGAVISATGRDPSRGNASFRRPVSNIQHNTFIINGLIFYKTQHTKKTTNAFHSFQRTISDETGHWFTAYHATVCFFRSLQTSSLRLRAGRDAPPAGADRRQNFCTFHVPLPAAFANPA